MMFPDFPHDFEAWDIDRQSLSLGRAVESEADAVVLHAGGLQGEVEFRRRLSENSTVAVRYRLDAFQPVLHLEYEIDWHDKQALLKVLFPTAYTGRTARFARPLAACSAASKPACRAMRRCSNRPASRWAIVGDDGDAEGLGRRHGSEIRLFLPRRRTGTFPAALAGRHGRRS